MGTQVFPMDQLGVTALGDAPGRAPSLMDELCAASRTPAGARTGFQPPSQPCGEGRGRTGRLSTSAPCRPRPRTAQRAFGRAGDCSRAWCWRRPAARWTHSSSPFRVTTGSCPSWTGAAARRARALQVRQRRRGQAPARAHGRAGAASSILIEKFHHSFFLYVLVSARGFLSCLLYTSRRG